MSLELKVFGRDGKETGEVISLDEGVFGIEPSESSVYLDVKSLLAARRQGTHKVKGRGEVRGGGRKPYKQKGTGGARRGSERSPLLVGGGSIFGPMPRDYKIKINKKVKSLARRSVLSAKLKDNEILVVEDFTFDEIKTKYFLSFIRDFGLISVKTLFLTMGKNEVLFKSGRNLKSLSVKQVELASSYDLLDCERLIFQKNAFVYIGKMLKNNI